LLLRAWRGRRHELAQRKEYGLDAVFDGH
jgi:hypothetical protein